MMNGYMHASLWKLYVLCCAHVLLLQYFLKGRVIMNSLKQSDQLALGSVSFIIYTH